jgi:hypothetical protein
MDVSLLKCRGILTRREAERVKRGALGYAFASGVFKQFVDQRLVRFALLRGEAAELCEE